MLSHPRRRPPGPYLVAALGAALLCVVPGFNVLNYFGSLAASLPLCVLVGVAVSRQAQGWCVHPGFRARRALTMSLQLAALPAVALTLNALRIPNCDLLEGLGFYLMGAGTSAVLMGQLAAAASLFGGGALRCALGSLGLMFGWLAWDAYHLYAHPPVYAFNPFLGYFSGAIYDDLIRLDHRYVVYRLANLMVLSLLWSLVSCLYRCDAKHVSWATRIRHASPRVICWMVLSLSGATTLYATRAETGYEHNSASIAEHLGGRITDGKITVLYDSERIGLSEAKGLAEAFRFHLESLEDRLDLTLEAPVLTAYIYGSRAQKRALMGAGRVEIAKPWLSQVHLTRVDEGASVIRHEVAHVLLASVVDNPFGVPMRFGVLPQALLIEGAAEALEWQDPYFTSHEWAAAMHEIGLAPPLQTLMAPEGFLLQAAGRSYTLAGSFLRWILETRGAPAFLKLYEHGHFEEALGIHLDDLTTQWRAFLGQIKVGPSVRARAQQRYDRKGVLRRRCPLEIARRQDDARRFMEAGDFLKAQRAFEGIIALDQDNPRHRLPLLALLSRQGSFTDVTQAFDALMGLEHVNPVMESFGLQCRADAAWRDELADSVTLYSRAMALPQSDASWRSTAIKRTLAGDSGDVRTVRDYLLAAPVHRDLSDAKAWLDGQIDHLEEAVATAGEPLLVRYLLGRALYRAGEWTRSLETLTEVLAQLEQDPPDVLLGEVELVPQLVEASRYVAARAALASGADKVAATHFRLLAARTVSTGRRLGYTRWLERLAWRR